MCLCWSMIDLIDLAHQIHYINFLFKTNVLGLPWQSSGLGFPLPMQGSEFSPWSGSWDLTSLHGVAKMARAGQSCHPSTLASGGDLDPTLPTSPSFWVWKAQPLLLSPKAFPDHSTGKLILLSLDSYSGYTLHIWPLITWCSPWLSLVQSFHKYLLNNCPVPSTDWVAGDPAVGRRWISAFVKLTGWRGRQREKQVNYAEL